MKKIFFLVVSINIVFLSINSYACDNYIRNEIHRAENSYSDAKENLEQIDRHTYRYGLDYCDTGYAFLELIYRIGNTKTSLIQSIVRNLAELADYEYARVKDYVPSSIEINQLENSNDDVLSNISLIKNEVKYNPISAKEAFAIFIRELRYFGATNTKKAQDSFKRIVSRGGYHDYPRRDHRDRYRNSHPRHERDRYHRPRDDRRNYDRRRRGGHHRPYRPPLR